MQHGKTEPLSPAVHLAVFLIISLHLLLIFGLHWPCFPPLGRMEALRRHAFYLRSRNKSLTSLRHVVLLHKLKKVQRPKQQEIKLKRSTYVIEGNFKMPYK